MFLALLASAVGSTWATVGSCIERPWLQGIVTVGTVGLVPNLCRTTRRAFPAAKRSASLDLAMNQYLLNPINTIFRGMNIHLPAIFMFTRGTRF